MTQTPEPGSAEAEQFDHGEATDRADEAAKPSDIGALDGAAAAGSPASAGTDPGGEEAVPTSAPDPEDGPD